MKKGIIMEQHRKYMIVLTEEGVFYKAIPVKNVEIGAEVTFKPIPAQKRFHFLSRGHKMNMPMRLLALVSIMLLFVLPFYFLMDNKKTYAYVGIDINPSVELQISEDLQVQSIRPINNDAENIVGKLGEYQGKALEDVIHMIMVESEETGLINNQKHMLVGVSLIQNNKGSSIIERMQRYFQVEGSEWDIATYYVPDEIRQEAEDNHMSMNEAMAAAIQEKDDTLTKNTDSETKLDDEDRAIINSFYNSKKESDSESNSEKVSEQDSLTDQTNAKDKQKNNPQSENNKEQQENPIQSKAPSTSSAKNSSKNEDTKQTEEKDQAKSKKKPTNTKKNEHKQTDRDNHKWEKDKQWYQKRHHDNEYEDESDYNCGREEKKSHGYRHKYGDDEEDTDDDKEDRDDEDEREYDD
ncbi:MULTISPECIES: anti-sigma factor domain-containing protein [Virgibacillus]|uniref:Regulation of sigma I protein n=2 Tax=Virgibacillus TaxID=84406 RepID=A0A024QFK9_9BACI|nr:MULTISPECIES: anti-sigma factor domain-containing protein [Virgibacillus]EQB35082.1 hypothetical protein M948_18460 [Virgibacillus sp. CM-4]GGJ70073.1 anti-sigma-I factor RsgI [Virgibacillus kapii]CDQ40756.1 Regulation of sigma I protein [Virgibacillus massiliensis]